MKPKNLDVNQPADRAKLRRKFGQPAKAPWATLAVNRREFDTLQSALTVAAAVYQGRPLKIVLNQARARQVIGRRMTTLLFKLGRQVDAQ